MQAWKRQKAFFEAFGPKRIVFRKKFVFFLILLHFLFKFNGCFVRLSIIGFIQSYSEEFGCISENSKKTPSFAVPRPKTQFSFL